MTRISLIFLFCVIASVYAEDALLVGGKSPDGKYQIRIYKTESENPSNYFFGVFDTKTHQLLKQLSEGGGFARYEGALELSTVIWHSSGHFFALTDHGTRHSMEMYIYGITGNEVTLIQQPDYYQNALGRVDATEGYLTVVVKPLQWKQDDLACNLIYDARTKESSRDMYSVDFTLRLRHGDSQSPALEFARMGRPKPQE